VAKEPDSVHQKSESGDFYTSKPASDPKAEGGRIISTGDKSGHTTHVYDSESNHVDTSTTGSGGPAKDVSPGGKQ